MAISGTPRLSDMGALMGEILRVRPRIALAMSCCALAALLVTACGGGAESGSGACVASARWHGHYYVHVPVRQSVQLTRGAVLSGVVEPACNDSNANPPQHDTPLNAWSLRGVAPGVAFVPERDHYERFLYVLARHLSVKQQRELSRYVRLEDLRGPYLDEG